MLKVLKLLSMSAAMGAVAMSHPASASAESHLPSLDIMPIVILLTSDNVTPAPGVPFVDGLKLNFSAHVPLAKGVTFSYDHLQNGLIANTLPRIAVGGMYVRSVVDFRDLVDGYRIDAVIGKGLSAEIGTAYRHRVCCPADTDVRNPTPTNYHDNYLGFTYATPSVRGLSNAFLIYNIKGHASPHFSDSVAAVAAANAAGYPDNKRTEFGITQAVTVVVPVDPKHGFSVAATNTWGAFNYFSNQAIPLYYNIIILSVDKSFTKHVSLSASVDNFIQRPQGYPFPSGNGINGASLNIGLNFQLGR